MLHHDYTEILLGIQDVEIKSAKEFTQMKKHGAVAHATAPSDCRQKGKHIEEAPANMV